jgi:hypothetical protein
MAGGAKGARTELAIVRLLQARGFAAKKSIAHWLHRTRSLNSGNRPPSAL